jgi:glycosyltransferase involved in cell wall biosynthesis
LKEKVDVLHLRSRLPAWIGYMAWKSVPADFRPCLVTTFHGFYSVNRYSAIMTKGQKIIAISKAIKSHIQEKYGVSDDRIVVIYRGVDEKVFSPGKITMDRMDYLSSRWGMVNTDVPLILLPARITRLKGHEVFIQSLHRIEHLNWHAICAGNTAENPKYVEELKSLASGFGLEKRITFVGHCDDMAAALMLSDLVVSATSQTPEAFGRVAIEAQAMGKPVVATAHGGSLETVLPGKTGWLVNPNDVTDMADALARALTDPSLRKVYGFNGQRFVKAHFTVEHMCRETLKVYHALLDKKLG